MRKKNKGSGFIIVIIIMAILFTTATSILTLASSDYKMRKNSSERIENLYSADSGLDIVYNIILKNSEAAIIYANKKIKEKYDGKEMSKELYEDINTDFKYEFINFLGREAREYGKSDNDAILAQGIINGKYMELGGNKEFIWKENINKKSDIEIIKYEYESSKNIIHIGIKSTFETIESKIKSKKILETKFMVSTPNYKEPISSDSIEIGIYPVFDGKIITADGNLKLQGEIKASGDIWVKGDAELDENPAYAFDKYKGGISIENGALNLDGNIITNRTLHLEKEAEATVIGNVYALNTYVGKSNKTDTSSNNKLSVKTDKSGQSGNVIVNNDLALNASESDISMSNFYGINDKTDESLIDISKAMKSSSIIINDTSNTSTLKVANDAYIMGVAYIDTLGEKYQTGESVAIKGNYLAYSDILEGYEDRVTLKYYNPLQLIDEIDGENDLEGKAKYFKKYYEKNNDSIKNGGVYLNEVHSIGAYVTNNNDNSSVGHTGINNEDNIVVSDKRRDFARNVFSMGNTNEINKTEDEIYNNGEVIRTVGNQIDFTKIDTTKVVNEKYGKLKLNKNSDKTIVIKGQGDNEVYNSNVYDVIDGSKDLKAVIITNGDVLVTGKVNLTGNIIAKGNIEFRGNKLDSKQNKKLIYDSDVTRKIIAINYELIKNALDNASTTGQQDNVNIGEEINIDISADGYNLKSLLKTGHWKIVK